MEHNSTFPIKLAELDALRNEATSYLKGVQWEQGGKAKSRDKNQKDESILLYLSNKWHRLNLQTTISLYSINLVLFFNIISIFSHENNEK